MCIDMVYIDLYKLHLNILISLKEEWQIEVDVTSYLFEHQKKYKLKYLVAEFLFDPHIFEISPKRCYNCFHILNINACIIVDRTEKKDVHEHVQPL